MTGPMRWISLAVSVAVAAAAAGVLYVRRGGAPLGVEEAVRRFRQSQASPQAEPASPPPPTASASGAPAVQPQAVRRPQQAAAAPSSTPAANAASAASRLPAPGVYAYRTTGFEEIDALGGERHDYPSTTTVTVRQGGCGYLRRWQPLEQRWDEMQICPGPSGDLLRTVETHHVFFGRAEARTLTCDPATLIRPPASAPAGTSWQGRCTSETTTTSTSIRGTLVGREVVDVGGKPVEVLHIRTEIQVSGDETGSASVEGWSVPETGLLVREIATTSVTGRQPPFGTVRYHEEYEIVLLSLDPRQ